MKGVQAGGLGWRHCHKAGIKIKDAGLLQIMYSAAAAQGGSCLRTWQQRSTHIQFHSA